MSHENQGKKEKSFQCSLCNMVFSVKQRFAQHYKLVHEKIKEFKCKFCGKEFGQKARMITHIESIHEKIKNHKCSECQKSFTRKDQLSVHFKTYHKNERPYECTVCDKGFVSMYNMKLHQKTMHTDKPKTLKCDLCSKYFSLEKQLKTHIKGVHQGIRNHSCDKCDKTYQTSSAMRYHKEMVHFGIKRHKCNDCEFGSTFPSDLQKHIKQVHLKIKSHKCGICEKYFTRSDHLKMHYAGMHSTKATCILCQKDLKSEFTLIQHIKRMHPNSDKLFQCDVCDNTYRTKRSLTVHKESVHEKKFYVKCDFCDLEIFHGSGLKNHIRIQHKGEVPKKTIHRKAYCNICHKNMRSLFGLNEHLNQVHKVRPYKCFQCKGLFVTLHDLKLHLQNAHAIKDPDKLSIDLELQSNSQGPSFECTICKKRFGQKAQLRMHFDSIHGEVKLSCDICGKVLLHQASLRAHMRHVHHQTQPKDA